MNVNEIVEVDPREDGRHALLYRTRVPIKNLFDYLETGDGLETFLDDFPTVSRQQAQDS